MRAREAGSGAQRVQAWHPPSWDGRWVECDCLTPYYTMRYATRLRTCIAGHPIVICGTTATRMMWGLRSAPFGPAIAPLGPPPRCSPRVPRQSEVAAKRVDKGFGATIQPGERQLKHVDRLLPRIADGARRTRPRVQIARNDNSLGADLE